MNDYEFYDFVVKILREIKEEIAALRDDQAKGKENGEREADAARLDGLEALIEQQPDKALLLHHGRVSNKGFPGLGLGNTNRTLRAAIDAARLAGGGEGL